MSSDIIKQAILLIGLLVSALQARNGNELLNHYAVGLLPDSTAAAGLCRRFKAGGDPVFLIHNVQIGLTLGDIIRFADKAVLVNEEVWETLRKEDIFRKISVTPVVFQTAGANSETWTRLAGRLPDTKDRNAVQLGAELLKVMEGYLGQPLEGQEIILRFIGGKMTLIAPEALMESFQFNRVRESGKSGLPEIISPSPIPIFIRQSLEWQAWAADPRDPSENIGYILEGELPEGIVWDSAAHRLIGSSMEPGSWPLRLRAANSSHKEDTLDFRLDFRRNQPPYLANRPPDVIYTGEQWKFRALIIDQDHPAKSLKLDYETDYDGIYYDKFTQTFSCTPSKFASGDVINLTLHITDPMDDSVRYNFRIKVEEPDPSLPAKALEMVPPWDTLCVGHTYDWPLEAALKDIEADNIRLLAVRGSDSTELTRTSVRLVPRSRGTHELHFIFSQGEDSVDYLVCLPVKPDLSPVFLSTLDTWKFRRGQKAVYRPVVQDPEGDPVTLELICLPEKRAHLKNKMLELYTQSSGMYTAEFLAMDAYGNYAKQKLVWKVLEDEKDWTGISMSSKLIGNYHILSACYQNAMGRIGLMTPRLSNIISPDSSAFREWPYIMAGVNLLKNMKTRSGEYLFVDMGFSLRKPHPRVVTGGIAFGVDARWIYSWPVSMMTELEFSGVANQFILAVDTTNLVPDSLERQMLLHNSDSLQQAVNQWRAIGEKLLEDYGNKDNFTLFLRWETVFPVWGGFSMGPTYWFHTRPIRVELENRLGTSLRHMLAWKTLILEQSLRLTTGGSNSGFRLWWDVKLNLGKWG